MTENDQLKDDDARQPDPEKRLRRQAEAEVEDPAGPSALVTDPSAAEGGRVTEGENEQREQIEG